MLKLLIAAITLAGRGTAVAAPHADVVVDRDDIEITESCRVVVPSGTVVRDANGDGVIHVKADNVTVEFAEGSELRGADPATAWDALTGIGLRVDGHKGVTLKNLRVHGYKVGVHASKAEGLTIAGANLSDNYRQRLRSTPMAEDGSDWLFPHQNDKDEWMTQHGAALCIEDSSKVSVSKVLVRRGQNGIILDRVDSSRIFDNDCSFLSGWGLAMWRSSQNTISRNAFDFCVRGYSHGVYNRGQDSAGILCFEQCTRNIFAENSATHGGDGFFGFAGREAIGETPPPFTGFPYEGRGCSDNVLIGNDFSYAVAHGIEMTFSHGNRFSRNRLVECGICGVWAGYSSATVIEDNTIERNGQMAYGLERGGVNIEHGANNYIVGNTFRENACGVHLWWDDDGELLRRPGVRANDRGVKGNVVAFNTFEGDGVCFQLRDSGEGHLGSNYYSGNTERGVGKSVDAPEGAEPVQAGDRPALKPVVPDVFGESTPVGAWASLAGRANIVMGEWGPWDHETPMMRFRGTSGGGAEFEIFGLPLWEGATTGKGHLRYSSSAAARGLSFEITASPGAEITITPGDVTVARVEGGRGVWSYDAVSNGPLGPPNRWNGTVVSSTWTVTCFPWTDETDPRKSLEAWRSLATGPGASHATLNALSCRFGNRGPRDLKWSDEVSTGGPGTDRFGVRASTRIAFPKGQWKVRTLSDDGVRVTVNGTPVVERWDWHAPTKDAGTFASDGAEAAVDVEYFEIDGYAVLEVEFEPDVAPSPR